MRWVGEIGRKAIHLSAILIPVGYYFIPEKLGRTILIALTVSSFVIDPGSGSRALQPAWGDLPPALEPDLRVRV
jgi:hypothetical protein